MPVAGRSLVTALAPTGVFGCERVEPDREVDLRVQRVRRGTFLKSCRKNGHAGKAAPVKRGKA